MLAEEWTDNLTTTEPDPAWLWRGLIAPRQLTLLTGLWKAGKTTLLSHLLFHRNCAGTLLGQPVRPGVTAVVTEEMRAQWRSRAQKLPPGRPRARSGLASWPASTTCRRWKRTPRPPASWHRRGSLASSPERWGNWDDMAAARYGRAA
jgi:hypothetical protein